MYSFNIYDTLITRMTYSPQGIFLIMQERLKTSFASSEIPEDLLNNFAALRIKAEKNARNFNKKNEISLPDIYHALAQMTVLSMENKNRIMDLEVETEADCAVEIKSTAQKIETLIQKKEPVVFISDMYLSEANIRRILKKVNPIYEKLPIYVSSEYDATKQDGSLYLKVKELENIPSYKTWIHYGDHNISDLNIPAMLGIKTIPVKAAISAPWEHCLKNYFDLNSDLPLQFVLGTMKMIRKNDSLNKKENSYSFFSGILLFSYVEWILEQCRQLNLTRLYFIARDGYILKQISDICISKYHLDIKTKYIYGSRKVWRVEEKEKQTAARNYILQEVDFSDDKFAFIDLSGTGYSVVNLTRILNKGIHWNFFYYSMEKPVKDPMCNFWIYHESMKGGLLETLCRAPHGATIGYKYCENHYVPQLSQIDEKKWTASGMQEYFRGIHVFTEEFLHNITVANCKINLRALGDFLVNYFCNTPDMETADFFGNIIHNFSNLEETSYAPKLSKKEIFQIFMWRTSEDSSEYYKGSDLEYSLFRMTPQDKKWMEFCQNHYMKPIGKAIHSYKNLLNKQKKSSARKRVVIYAAGTRGKKLYHTIQISSKMKIAGWTDIDAAKYREMGYPVQKLSEISQMDFDILVIAIKNQKSADTVKKLLVEAGIESRKIMQEEEFVSKYLNV